MNPYPPIKVGFLVSYDWYLLKNSLPLVYTKADVIYLALDKKRLTWSGNTFDFDEYAFKEMIKTIDCDKKIYIYEDDFFVKGLTPMQCEVRERNLLAKEMGEGGWHIQLDADEYFLRFNEFTNFLKKIPLSQKEINICVVLINLFKKTEKGFLYTMHNELELIQVATNRPLYEHGRRNGYFNFISPFFLLHNTWARNEEEIWQKISNWGHTSDFDTEKYFQFWKSVNEENFKNIKNFHPIYPSAWKALGFTEAKNIEELILKFSEKKFPLNKFQLFLINNRNIARIKHFWSKLFG
jgi:hypothetical protein